MEKYVIDCGATPEIYLGNIGGDLNLKGQEANQVIVKTNAVEDFELVKDGEKIRIDCPDDCTIYVPHTASLRIDNVNGDASLKSLGGQVKIENIARELVLRDVDSASIDNIGLDLSAKRVRGDLTVSNIGRGAIVRDVNGLFKASSIGAHLLLRDVSGGIIAEAGGNADVTLAPVPWQTYSITAGGNISCRLAEESNAEVRAYSGAQKIKLDLPDQARLVRESEYSLSIGEGGPEITLQAGAAVEIRSRSTGWESIGTYDTDINVDMEEFDNLAEQIEMQVTQQLESINEQIDTYFEQIENTNDWPLSPEWRKNLDERMRRAQDRAHRASDRAQRKMEKAQEKMRQKAEYRRSHGTQPRQPGHPPPPPAPPSPGRRFVWPLSESEQNEELAEAVSDDERLLILKMLEQKKISAEEAEQLLAALEGRAE
jgi:hypothetical protein